MTSLDHVCKSLGLNLNFSKKIQKCKNRFFVCINYKKEKKAKKKKKEESPLIKSESKFEPITVI